MGHSADVKSHESIERFRIYLIQFQELCSHALMQLETEKHQAMQWLEYDMPMYWKKQARVRYDELTEAKASLRSCEMRGTIDGKKPSCVEEKKAVEKAKTRLEYAQRMVPIVKRWAVKIQKESDEFTGRIGRCKSIVDNDVTHAVHLLRQMVKALEKYLELSAPTGESIRIQDFDSKVTRTTPETAEKETDESETAETPQEEASAEEETTEVSPEEEVQPDEREVQ